MSSSEEEHEESLPEPAKVDPKEVEERTAAYSVLYERAGKIIRQCGGLIRHEEAMQLAKKELLREAADEVYKVVARVRLYDSDSYGELKSWVDHAKTPQERLMIENAIKRFNRAQQRFLQKQKEQEQQEKQNEQKKKE
jgi:hypothetical protein